MKILILVFVSFFLLLSCSEDNNPVTPTKGNIFITSSPSGAQIWLQGVNTSQITPDTLLNLTPGSYLITLKFQNYKDTTFTISVTEGQITSKSVTLTQILNTGSIYLTSIPSEAEIWLNGVSTAMTTPDTIKNLPPGNYEVTLMLENYKDTTFTVSLSWGQVTSKSITLIPGETEGSMFISSIPAGAEIWINGTNTFRTTPDSVENLYEGVYAVTLKLEEYYDTTFSVNITGGQLSVVGPIILVSDINIILYGPVRIYESYGAPASLPTGIDLSRGNAWGISSDSSGYVDIYYYTDASGSTYQIQSADEAPNLIRVTDFFVGTGNNLSDDEDSPLRSFGTWSDNMDDTENNYVFLYDHDGHYSKIIIVNRGGGSGPGDPAWVDLQWYYNRVMLDNRF